MMMYKVLNNFSSSKYPDPAFQVLGQEVLEHMTDNPRFITPAPTLTEVQTALTEFVNTVGKVKYGSREDVLNKKAARATLESLMRGLASYVQSVSKGDEAIIISSGFDVSKQAAPIGPLPMPTGIQITAGSTRGSLYISWDSIKDAHSYIVEYIEYPYAEMAAWYHIGCTRSNATISNLTRGKQYAIKVTAIGSDPSRLASDEFFSFVM